MAHKILVCSLLLLGVLGASAGVYSQSQYGDIEEDARLDVVGLLTKYGYPSETHVAQTEDGYLLTVHRITGGKGSRGQQKEEKPVVFLMHCLLCSSADWISLGPNISLGYLLADEGYDVWMGNARGNFYSRKHILLNPDKSDFWKFSWNEIGYYDLPAMINKVLDVTGKEQIQYIGHSQGTTSFFVMASTRPEFNKKIKFMQALAPVAYLSNAESPMIKLLGSFPNTVEIISSLFGVDELLPNSELMTIAGDLLCKDNAIFQPVCSNILFLICGNSPELLNATQLPIILGHTPAGSSTRQLIHYAQEYGSGKFRKYDHGLIGNMGEYGQISPPEYKLQYITTPVALHYSDNDLMSHPDDVTQLYHELGNAVGKFRVPHPQFNHLDYLWAIDVRTLLYSRVLSLMKAFD